MREALATLVAAVRAEDRPLRLEYAPVNVALIRADAALADAVMLRGETPSRAGLVQHALHAAGYERASDITNAEAEAVYAAILSSLRDEDTAQATHGRTR